MSQQQSNMYCDLPVARPVYARSLYSVVNAPHMHTEYMHSMSQQQSKMYHDLHSTTETNAYHSAYNRLRPTKQVRALLHCMSKGLV